MIRLLVTGGDGQLGSELGRVAEGLGDEVVAVDRADLDITDRDQVLGAITQMRPTAVVNCAAWTDVDGCEADPAGAMVANALAVRFLAEACDRVGAHLVTISTDYVFDGAKPAPYDEWDEPSPQSVYGRSKLAGEREAGARSTVVRTSWLCGAVGSNMVKTVLRVAGERAASGSPMRFVDDQRGHPTFAADLAPVLRRFAVERRPGVFHVTNQGPVSWYEFVQAILAEAGFDPALVEPITTAELQPPRPARRPANSVLDNLAMRASGMALLPHFSEPLARLIRDLQA